MGRLLFLLPLLACAQTRTGSIQGEATDIVGHKLADQEISLRSIDNVEVNAVRSARDGKFRFVGVTPGWYLLLAVSNDYESVKGVRVDAGATLNARGFQTPLGIVDCAHPDVICDYFHSAPPPRPLTSVLTVCEALDSGTTRNFDPVVIVGIFKSGLDETLRQDCPNQLVTGDIGWMSAIALTHPTDPPESLRAEIEKKRASVLAGAPPGARVTAFYGRLVSPSGLTSIACCTAPVEINAAPARLLGLDERDFRVLR